MDTELWKMEGIIRKLEEENQYLRSVISDLSLSNPSFEEIRDEIDLEVGPSGRIYHSNTRLVFENLVLDKTSGFTLVCVGSFVFAGIGNIDEAQVLPFVKTDYASRDALASLNRLLADIGLEILPLSVVESRLSPFDMNRLKARGLIRLRV